MSLRRMRRVPLYFILTLCALVSCERKHPAARVTEPSSSPASPTPIQSIAVPSAQPSQTPTSDFAQIAQSIRPAVIIVSVFDETGHLTANGHGFFVSDDGKFIADRSVIAGGVNAVAKAADGAIYNVSGALAQAAAQNLVLLKADATRTLPFLAASAKALPDIGGNVAVVLSQVERANSGVLEEKISGRFSDEAGEWFDLAPVLPKTSAGAPVIDQRGEVIGIVTFRAGNNSCAMRPAAIAGTLLAQVSSNMIATWENLTTSSHLTTPTASPTANRSPTPAKIPVRGSKLIYAPAPRYPTEARRSRGAGQAPASSAVWSAPMGKPVRAQIFAPTEIHPSTQPPVLPLQHGRRKQGQTGVL